MAHERALAQDGGLGGIKNLGLVQSAIARPYLGYDRSIVRKAAALVESVATNHGFNDGNKRTTVILLHVLLDRSGYQLEPLDGEDLNDAITQLVLSVAGGGLRKPDLVAWFKPRIRRME